MGKVNKSKKLGKTKKLFNFSLRNFFKMAVLKISENSQESTCGGVLFCNFIKIVP